MKLKIPLLALGLLLTISFVAIGQPAQDPDPLRFETEINTFTEWDLKNSSPADAILFIGSSSIRLWNTAEAFPEYPIINRGFGGSHTSDILYYYDEVIGRFDPSLIVFYAGDNDIAADKPVDQVFDDYLELIGSIADDHPGSRFLYVPVKPSNSRWDYWETMNELNQRIREYNNQHEWLNYIDLATPLLGDDQRPDDSYFLEDQLHLNEEGYRVWNREMAPVLEQLMR